MVRRPDCPGREMTANDRLPPMELRLLRGIPTRVPLAGGELSLGINSVSDDQSRARVSVFSDEGGGSHELAVGSTLPVGAASYRVVEITPARVVLARVADA